MYSLITNLSRPNSKKRIQVTISQNNLPNIRWLIIINLKSQYKKKMIFGICTMTRIWMSSPETGINPRNQNNRKVRETKRICRESLRKMRIMIRSGYKNLTLKSIKSKILRLPDTTKLMDLLIDEFMIFLLLKMNL